jgi:Tol biopolymer transport system component
MKNVASSKVLATAFQERRGSRRRSLAILVALTIAGAVLGAGSGQAGGATITNGKIAFGRDDPAVDAALSFTINPDGTGETRAGGAGCEAWSPDSSKLLMCTDNPEGRARPATANPDGSDFTLLDAYPNLEQNLGCAYWSPDAARLLCDSGEGNPDVADNGMYTVRASDGGDLFRVTTTPAGFEDVPLGYSPNGSRILFGRIGGDDAGDLFSIHPDGTGILELNPPGLQLRAADCCTPAAHWSPDGTRIAFAAFWKPNTGSARRTALFIINADGTSLRRITPLGLGARDGATWSPDGRLIAFNTRFVGSPGPQIWVVRPDGSGLRQLTFPTSSDYSYDPQWSPDSTKLVFQSFHPEINGGQQDLWIVDADGTKLTQLTNTPEPAEEHNPTWGSAPPS